MGRKSSSVLILASTLCLSSVAMAQTTPNRAPSKSYTKPITGPELTGPITRPSSSATPKTDEIKSKSDKSADLAYGAFQRGYYLTALRLALPRAESGDPAAQTLIAELYWNGLGIARDQKKALEWYKFAAESGNKEAQFAYANILLRGRLVPVDKKAGEEFMKKSADAGHSRAQFNLAQILTAKRPTWAGFKRALPYYSAAAKAGIADAQYALANMYAEARGVTYNDDKTAREWLQKSAQGGFDTAEVEYAIWLANGRGGKQDIKEARFWFLKAASKGNVIAQNRLAHIYANGAGVERDAIKASAWHILARRAGFSDSKMDRFFQALSEIDKKRAIEAANQLSKRKTS